MFEMLFADLDPASQAPLPSQTGAGASCTFTVPPTRPDFVVPGEEFCVLLLRRLRLARPLVPSDASVGAASTSWGTTGPLVPKSESWHTEQGLWSARRRASVGKPVFESPQASPCEKLTSMPLPLTAGGLRSSPTALCFGEGPELRSTRRWSARWARQTWGRCEASASTSASQAARRARTLSPGGLRTRGLALLRQLARARDRALWAREAAGAALTRRWTALTAPAALRAHAQSLLELPVRCRTC